MLSDKRKTFVEQIWHHRRGAWQVPFQTILANVMVSEFWNDDDYDEVRAYLTERFYY